MAEFVDIESLRAFSVVARELNMRQAADKLNISQPPLSRRIKKLEDYLGLRLFVRRSYGLELTRAGKEVLETVRPLLDMQEETQARLESLKKSEAIVIGLTTAFEHDIYEPLIKQLKSSYGNKIIIKRAASIHLANDLAKRNTQAAWVALPLEKSGISILKTGYSEALLAVLPESWQKLGADIELAELNGRPFFWFAASRNPCWHERMAIVFRQLRFKPDYIDEPPEYEVLLGRIAAGEGWTLIPQSFAALQRKGIKYGGVRNIPPLELGIAYAGKEGELIALNFRDALKAPVQASYAQEPLNIRPGLTS